MSKSKIEWTDETWNPVTGCDKVSPGCKNCYAEVMAKRLLAMGQKKYRNGFKLTLHENALDLPLSWKKPKFIFVNSMSDLFHKDVPLEFIQRVFDTMERAHWHRFQVLTKRADRLAAVAEHLPWPSNVWMGVSAENQECWNERVPLLATVPAAVRFVSAEPLLGPIRVQPDLLIADVELPHWLIVGGESGPKARPVDQGWVRSLRDQAVLKGVAFHFKQWGGTNKKKAGRELDGRTWDEMPEPTLLNT